MKMALHYYHDKPNFGDQISPVIVDALLNDSTQRVAWTENGEAVKMSAVGSVIHTLRDGTKVWGSGIMSEQKPSTKLEFHAVRGPKTRKFLLECGYDENQVPEIYGDPALLLPEFYTPKVLPWTRDMWVVIPHHTCLDSAHRRNYWGNLTAEEFELWELFGYRVVFPNEPWQDVVDAIANAKGVISESLHGLILADAYGVPNVWWNENGDNGLAGHAGNFKFEDYFQSVGQINRKFVTHFKEVTEDNWQHLMSVETGTSLVDNEVLRSAFPFKSLSE
jgi:pyruvyltransferase